MRLRRNIGQLNKVCCGFSVIFKFYCLFPVCHATCCNYNTACKAKHPEVQSCSVVLQLIVIIDFCLFRHSKLSDIIPSQNEL